MQLHYGRASFSSLSSVPAYFLLGHESLDAALVAQELAAYAATPLNPEGMEAVLVFLDQPYLWALHSIKECLSKVQGNQV